MADLVIDTDVVSYGFRLDPIFRDFYGPAIQGHRGVVSFMTIAELEYGVLHRGWGERRINEMRRYLAANYVDCGVTRQICDSWAELTHEARTLGRVLMHADAWIAATARALNVPLVTNNSKDFSYLPGVTLITNAST
ncbi:PIN domain-containing protein [Crateriforma conspicua]|uniref:PIN domain-containing protein n=1 Tax=Crateriforma conspicua TaxID=2527996 RepID=UPI00118804B9|nr:Toxin VapC4 [Crateriforma conspicua]